MGQFSWLTADTKEIIYNDYDKQPVYLLIPKEFGGGYVVEQDYEGYGIFGGYDIYELLAIWNKDHPYKDGIVVDYLKFETGAIPDLKQFGKHTQHNRSIGIAIGCHDEDQPRLKYPKKLTSKPMAYEDCEDFSRSRGAQQGWHEYY